MDVLFKDESYAIVGACFEVYNGMGCGFLEMVYQECLCLEFGSQNISYVQKQPLSLRYKEHLLRQTYEPDFICFENIILEIKAASAIGDNHRAQVHNYLKATGLRLGILANFGQHSKLEWERIVR